MCYSIPFIKMSFHGFKAEGMWNKKCKTACTWFTGSVYLMNLTSRAATSVTSPAELSFWAWQADILSCRDVNLWWQPCSNWPKCSSLLAPSSRREHTPCGHFRHTKPQSEGLYIISQAYCDYTKSVVHNLFCLMYIYILIRWAQVSLHQPDWSCSKYVQFNSF